MQTQEFSPYERVLDSIRQLNPREQLALASDIVSGLREFVNEVDELAEAARLSKMATFQRLVEDGLAQIREGKVQPIEALFDEL